MATQRSLSKLLTVRIVGLFDIGNWNSWLSGPSSLDQHMCLYWCYLFIFIFATNIYIYIYIYIYIPCTMCA